MPVAQDPLLTTWVEQTTVQRPQLTKLTSNLFSLDIGAKPDNH